MIAGKHIDSMNRPRSAAVPAAPTGAVRPDSGDVTTRNRGRLPHWEAEGSTYFVTFRLADSLLKSALSKIKAEFALLEKSAAKKDVAQIIKT